MIRLSVLSENFKRAGLPSGEASRIRQYERFMGEAIENLRMIKNYRTPQTLRSFARIFTTLLPPFFAPTYAQIAKVRPRLIVQEHSCSRSMYPHLLYSKLSKEYKFTTDVDYFCCYYISLFECIARRR
jgi:hypothetical protein